MIIRIAAATIALLLAAGLWRDGRDRRLAIFFTLFALGLTGFLAGNTPTDTLKLPGLLGVGLSLLSGYNAIFLWWFVLAIFDDEFRPGLFEGSVGAVWFVIATGNRGFFGPEIDALPLNDILLVMVGGIVLHIFWRLWRDWEGDLEPARRHARGGLALAMASLLGIDVAIDLVMGTNWKPQTLTLAYNAAALVTLLWLFALLSRFNLSPLQFKDRSTTVEHVKQSTNSDLSDKINHLIRHNKIHLEQSLSFHDFVARTGFAEAVVRQYINHELGFRHFRTFLNHHRVAEAKRRLADPEFVHDKIIAIAFDSGFSSLASFHRTFRSVEGETPGSFRQRILSHKRADLGFET